MAGTIEVGPLVAGEVRRGAVATRRGLRVDGHAQVLSARPSRRPVAGLSPARDCSNGVYAGSQPGAGCTIEAATTSASRAGRQLTPAAPQALERGGITAAI
jgi:hypothetical protein